MFATHYFVFDIDDEKVHGPFFEKTSAESCPDDLDLPRMQANYALLAIGLDAFDEPDKDNIGVYIDAKFDSWLHQ